MLKQQRIVYTLCCFVIQKTVQGLFCLKFGNITNRKCLVENQAVLKHFLILIMKKSQKIERDKESNHSNFGIPFGRMVLMIGGLIGIITIVMAYSGCSSLSLKLNILGSKVDLQRGECPLIILPK